MKKILIIVGVIVLGLVGFIFLRKKDFIESITRQKNGHEVQNDTNTAILSDAFIEGPKEKENLNKISMTYDFISENYGLSEKALENGQDWILVTNLIATDKSEAKDVLDDQSGYSIIKHDGGSNNYEKFDSNTGYPVVFDPYRHTLGVIIGNFSCILKKKSNPSLIASNHNLTLLYEKGEFAFFKTKEGDSIEDKYRELQNDKGIKIVEMEIAVKKPQVH